MALGSHGIYNMVESLGRAPFQEILQRPGHHWMLQPHIHVFHPRERRMKQDSVRPPSTAAGAEEEVRQRQQRRKGREREVPRTDDRATIGADHT